MDIPRVLSTRIDPIEIDSEAHNVELNSDYPLEFYEGSEKKVPSNSVSELLDLVSNRLDSPEQYENYKFSHDSSSINMGPVESKYVTLDSMADKALASLELASRTRASNAKYVAEPKSPAVKRSPKQGSQRHTEKTKCRWTLQN